MKYEMIFGDEGLFFDAQKDCEMVGNGHHKVENGKLMVWNFSEKYWAESHTNKITISAMRRIIAEPKRWTLEDKKAGLLPEVGCRIYVPIMFEEQTVIYSSEKVIVSISDNGGAVTRTEVASINRIKPIETPEEKAQRLKSEWCAKAAKQLKNLEYTSTLTSIYDAMLSGELQAPKGE